MVVARTSQVDAARLLLKRGANVNAVEKWRGQTALMWAAAQSQPAMVRELIARGADVNARSIVNDWERQVTAEPRAIYRPAGGLTPLLYAAREGCVDCVDALVDARRRHQPARIRRAITPLLMAVINMQFDTAAALIRARREPEQVGPVGTRPALRGGRREHDSARRAAGSARRSTRPPACR